MNASTLVERRRRGTTSEITPNEAPRTVTPPMKQNREILPKIARKPTPFYY